jgi:hypothetical protein
MAALKEPPAPAAPIPAQRLPQAYYLDDFMAVIRGVEQRYGPLLSIEERDFLTKLKSLTQPALRLFVRLSNRKGPFFRADQIAYEEIGCIAVLLAELREAGLLKVCLDMPEAVQRKRLFRVTSRCVASVRSSHQHHCRELPHQARYGKPLCLLG